MNATVGIIATGMALAAGGAGADDGLAGVLPALRVCFAENDLPRSGRQRGAGLDIDVARLVAADLARPLQIVWLPERDQIDEVTDITFGALLANQCDTQLSVPGAVAIAGYEDRLVLSQPYYAAAYELIPETADWQWGQSFDGVIAVLGNTVAHVAIDAVGLRWSMQRSARDIETAVAQGSAAMGVVWGPNLTSLDSRRASAFEPPPVLRWNHHAATRRDDPLLAALNRVFAASSFRRRMVDLLAAHRLPVRGPYDTVYTPDALQALKNR